MPHMLRLLPIRWQDHLRWFRDATRLASVPVVACDATRLAPFDAAVLRRWLTAPVGGPDWLAVRAEMATYGISDEADGVNPGDRRALYQLVRALAPTRVLEIGTHVGASTAHIAAALRDNSGQGGPQGTLTTVDLVDVNDRERGPWRRFGAPGSPAEVIARLGMAERTTFVTRPSLSFLRDTSDHWDFIFLDGDHRAATVYREIPAALERLRPGGFLLLHDYFPRATPLWPGDPVIPGVWLAGERLRAEGAGIGIIPLGDLPWPTKLGRSVTSLAALTRVA